MAIVGSIVYPPAMGFLSVTVGLTFAMLGNALLAVACVVALVAFRRATNVSVGAGDAAAVASLRRP